MVDLHELLVTRLNVGGFLARVGAVVLGKGWIMLVLGAPLEDLESDHGDLKYCQSTEVGAGKLGHLQQRG